MLSDFFPVWPLIFTIDLARYLLTAGLVTALLALLAARLSSRRLHGRPAPPGQVAGEIAASLRSVVVFSLFGFGIYLGKRQGVFLEYDGIGEYGWAYFAGSLALAIVAQDAYFYWTHRAMHHPALFRLFHRLHHRSVRPTPWTAYSFDLPEAAVQAAFLPLFLLVVPMHDLAVFLFITHMIVRNVIGHCGYELLPRRLADSKGWGWISTVTHHDLHHASFRWNYGLYFTWWDRLLNTEHPEYGARLRAAGKSVAPVLLIAAASLFPSPGALASPEIGGDWATQGFSAKVRIEECSPGELCGRIVWLWDPVDSAGKQLVGVRILRGFRRGAAGEWTGGTVYDPEDGRTYSASLRLGAEGELRLKGCAFSVFCRTEVWRRPSGVCR